MLGLQEPIAVTNDSVILSKNIYSIQYIKLICNQIEACASNQLDTSIDPSTLCVIPKSEFSKGF